MVNLETVQYQYISIQIPNYFQVLIQIQFEMIMNNFSLALFLVLFCTFGNVSSVEWQAGGNVTDYLPYIWANIEDNIGSYIGASTDLAGFAKNLSDTFTARWDPAWNVVVLELVEDKTLDAIVMGYAFNDHWMWYNGYSYNGRTFSFIIWKDYNCKQWNKLGSSSFKSVVPLQKPISGVVNLAYSAMKSANSGLNYYGDIWATASLTNQQIRTKYPTHAYTIVAFQKASISAVLQVGGNICSVGSVESYIPYSVTINLGGGNSKSLVLFVIHTMEPTQ